MKYENIVNCQFLTQKNVTMHFHQDIEILYILEGSLEVCFEEQKYFLEKEEFLLINSNVRHEYHTDKELLIGSVFIDYTMLTEIFNGEQILFLCNSAQEHTESYEKMRHYIRQIFNYYQSTEGQSIALKNSIYYQLIYLITSDFIVKKGMLEYESLRGIQDERMNGILNYLTLNYKESITLKELAQRLYLSNAYLSKYISKNFGMNFLKLLNNIRVEHAVGELMHSDKTIIKIAMDNGFSNLASFNHAFKECYQLSPIEYRDKMQKSQIKTEQTVSREIQDKVEQYLITNKINAVDTTGGTMIETDIEPDLQQPLIKNWCKMINLGDASLLLRYDVRQQLIFLKEKLNFEYVRFWNIFSGNLMIEMGEKVTKYNFSLLDQIIDFLCANGMKPHIELGVKQNTMYGQIEPSILTKHDRNRIQEIAHNKNFLMEFIRHCIRRYSIKEVNTWCFELEKNSFTYESVTIDEYLEVFETMASIFKSYAPEVKIGGAGFSLNRDEKTFIDMLAKWKKKKNQPDFISIYSYPYMMEKELLDAGRNPYSSDESYLYHQIKLAKSIMAEQGMQHIEIMVSEWSSFLSSRNCLNDGCFKSAYILKNLIQCYEEVECIGYWAATDILAEGVESKRTLFGGCGLLNREGIRKPAFYAFEYMNHLENHYLTSNQNSIVTMNREGQYIICCHNFKHFNFRFYSMNESKIDIENQQRLFQDNESIQMLYRFHHVANGRYVIKTLSVGAVHGNVQAEWKKLDYLEDLSKYEIEYLKKRCQPDMRIFHLEAKNNLLELEIKIQAQEILAIIVAED